MDSADGVTTHAIWGLTDGLPCKETVEDWQRLDFMSKSRTGKDTKRILVEVSNYTGCPAAQGGTLFTVLSVKVPYHSDFLTRKLLDFSYIPTLRTSSLSLPPV
jgi:hypothetical protein